MEPLKKGRISISEVKNDDNKTFTLSNAKIPFNGCLLKILGKNCLLLFSKENALFSEKIPFLTQPCWFFFKSSRFWEHVGKKYSMHSEDKSFYPEEKKLNFSKSTSWKNKGDAKSHGAEKRQNFLMTEISGRWGSKNCPIKSFDHFPPTT